MSNYYLLDDPILLQYAFYPRDEVSPCPEYAFDINVPVEEDIEVSCRFFMSDSSYPTLLFFHGNGEVASDYDGIAPYFFKLAQVNLVVAEFRGYGASGGLPSFAALVADAHPLYGAVAAELSARDYNESLWLMGRSMGSVAALELAYHYPEDIKGLIIESGFMCAARIARRLGIPIEEPELELLEDECLQKALGIKIPALIIHGDKDSLVPVVEAYNLEKELGSEKKELLLIPGAEHNTVMMLGLEQYFAAIRDFVRDKK